MAALQRVADSRWRRFEPLDAELRHELYRASPAFAELAPVLEGPLFRLPFMLAENGERSSVFFAWCVREAAASAGWHRDASEAKRRYRRLAREVNDAVDRGLVPGGPRRTRLLPRLEPSLWPTALGEAWKLLKDTWELRFPYLEPKSFLPRIEVDEATESWSRRVLREPFAWNAAQAARKHHARRLLTDAWVVVSPVLIASGLVGALLGLARLRREPWSAAGVLWATAMVLLLSRVAFLAYLRTYAFPSTTHYLVPFYPLLPLASLLALADARSRLGARGPGVALRASARRLAKVGLAALGIVLLATVAIARDAARRPEPRWWSPDRAERVDFGGRRVALALAGLEVGTSGAGLSLRATRSNPTLRVHVLDPLRVAASELLLDLEWTGPAPLPLVVEYRGAGAPSAPSRHELELAGRGRATLRISTELPFPSSLTLRPALRRGARFTLHACRLVPAPPVSPLGGG
jgi:hypothetical protein